MSKIRRTGIAKIPIIQEENSSMSLSLNSEFKRKEIEKIAKDIGMDVDETEDQLFLLEQMRDTELPFGWSKEIDNQGVIGYYDKKSKLLSTQHPCIKKFRRIYYECLEELNRTANNFSKEKSAANNNNVTTAPTSKDPKEQPTPKINTRRDKGTSKQAMAKTQKTITSVENETVIIRLLDESARASKWVDLVRDNYEKENYIVSNKQTTIAQIDRAMRNAQKYYVEKYGDDPVVFQGLIKQTDPYKLANPQDVASAIILFGIVENENYLFWLARAYEALELPEFWELAKGSNEEGNSYRNTLEKLEIKVHPSYTFIESMIKKNRNAKDKAIKDFIWNKNPFEDEKNEIFTDCLLRDYRVNMTDLLYEIKNQELRIKKRLEEETKDNPDYVVAIENKPLDLKSHKRISSNFQDLHLFEIAKQLGIDLKRKIYLLIFIDEFVRKKESEDGESAWRFRVNPNGSVYWIHLSEHVYSTDYPYLKDLKESIDRYDKTINLDLNHANENEDHWNFITLYIHDNIEAEKFKNLLEKESLTYTKEVMKLIKYKDRDFSLNRILKMEKYMPSSLRPFLEKYQIPANKIYDIILPSKYDFASFCEYLEARKNFMNKANHNVNMHKDEDVDFSYDTNYDVHRGKDIKFDQKINYPTDMNLNENDDTENGSNKVLTRGYFKRKSKKIKQTFVKMIDKLANLNNDSVREFPSESEMTYDQMESVLLKSRSFDSPKNQTSESNLKSSSNIEFDNETSSSSEGIEDVNNISPNEAQKKAKFFDASPNSPYEKNKQTHVKTLITNQTSIDTLDISLRNKLGSMKIDINPSSDLSKSSGDDLNSKNHQALIKQHILGLTEEKSEVAGPQDVNKSLKTIIERNLDVILKNESKLDSSEQHSLIAKNSIFNEGGKLKDNITGKIITKNKERVLLPSAQNTLDMIVASLNKNDDSFYKTKRQIMEKKYDMSGVMRRFGVYKVPTKMKFDHVVKKVITNPNTINRAVLNKIPTISSNSNSLGPTSGIIASTSNISLSHLDSTKFKDDGNPQGKSISLNSLKRKIDIIIADYIVKYFNIVDLERPDETISDENEKKKFLMHKKQISIPKIRERIFALIEDDMKPFENVKVYDDMPESVKEIFRDEILAFFKEEEARMLERSALTLLVRQDPENYRVTFTVKAKDDKSQGPIINISPRGNSFKEINNYLLNKKRAFYQSEIEIYKEILRDISTLPEINITFGNNPIIKVSSPENIDRNLYWGRVKKNEYLLEETSVEKAAYFLRIKARLDTDLIWIPYLFCSQILKTGVEEHEISTELKNTAKWLNLKHFFRIILQLNVLKRRILLKKLQKHEKNEYFFYNSWIKLRKKDAFFYLNLVSGARKFELDAKTESKMQEYVVLERKEWNEFKEIFDSAEENVDQNQDITSMDKIELNEGNNSDSDINTTPVGNSSANHLINIIKIQNSKSDVEEVSQGLEESKKELPVDDSFSSRVNSFRPKLTLFNSNRMKTMEVNRSGSNEKVAEDVENTPKNTMYSSGHKEKSPKEVSSGLSNQKERSPKDMSPGLKNPKEKYSGEASPGLRHPKERSPTYKEPRNKLPEIGHSPLVKIAGNHSRFLTRARSFENIDSPFKITKLKKINEKEPVLPHIVNSTNKKTVFSKGKSPKNGSTEG